MSIFIMQHGKFWPQAVLTVALSAGMAQAATVSTVQLPAQPLEKSLIQLACQRQDYWPFFAIFNVRYCSLMLPAFRNFIITDWRGVFCQHSGFAFFL